MLPIRPRLFFSALSLAAAAGCGTLLNQNVTPCGNNAKAHRIYGGIREELEGAAGGGDKNWWVCLDMPFTLIGDTLFLPLDIVHTCLGSRAEGKPSSETSECPVTTPTSGGRSATMPAAEDSQGGK